MNRDTKHKKIILVTRTGSITYGQKSIDDVLALNEGHYEERYILAKINGEYRTIWDYEDEAFENIPLEQYLADNKIPFNKEYGIETIDLHEPLSQYGSKVQRHTGNNTFTLPLDNGEEITIWEEIKGESKEYATRSEYIDIEDKLKRFTHTFTSKKALFKYIDSVVEG